MHRVRKSASAIVFLWTALCVTLLGTASASAQTDPDFVFDAGVACDFELGLDVLGAQQVMREFVDKDGNLRWLAAGKGSVLTFTNLETEETLTVTTGGSVSHITDNGDGTVTIVGTGHNVLLLFPSDVPAGPSTTLTQGRIVFTYDPITGFTTVTEVKGKVTDICAALSD